MTSLDDQLRDLFRTAGPDEDVFDGDVRDVRARVRQQALRCRFALGSVAAGLVVGGGLLFGSLRDDGDRVVTTPDTTDTTGTTPRPTTSTVPSTSTSSTSTSSTSTSTPTAPALGPSARTINFGLQTYPAPCPAFDDQPVTLYQETTGYVSRDVLSADAMLISWLTTVSYTDADGDGDEDAVVVIGCIFSGADIDTGSWVGVYRAADDGSPELIGTPLVLEHTFDGDQLGSPDDPTLDGLTLTVKLDKYAEADAACCPSAAAEEVWRFDGSRFVQVATTPLPPRPQD